MTIASRANVLRMGFMILVLGKRLTADYMDFGFRTGGSPEMRPDDFREQLFIAGDKAARLPPEIDQAFQVMNDCRKQQIDNGLPSYVVDQRFVRKTIDQRQHVRDQHGLAENEGGDGN